MKEYGAGGVITELRDVTHRAENEGSTRVVLHRRRHRKP
jgi:hypothetical protein